MIMRLKHGCLWLVLSSLAISLLTAADASGQPDRPNALAPKSYQIRNVKYGDLLRPEDARNADGTPIVLYPAQPWKCMTWKLHPAGESRFQLQNHFTSKTFSAQTGDQEAAAVTQVPFSKNPEGRPTWQFTKLKGDGTYKITEVKTGKALTAVKDGNLGMRIVVQAWHDGEDQKWELKEINPKDLTM